MKPLILLLLLVPCMAFAQSPTPSISPTPTQQELLNAALARIQAQKAQQEQDQAAQAAIKENEAREAAIKKAINFRLSGKVLSVTKSGLLIVLDDDRIIFLRGNGIAAADGDPINCWAQWDGLMYQYTAVSGALATVHSAICSDYNPPAEKPKTALGELDKNGLRGTSLDAPPHR